LAGQHGESGASSGAPVAVHEAGPVRGAEAQQPGLAERAARRQLGERAAVDVLHAGS